MKLIALYLLLLACSVSGFAQESKPPTGTIEFISDALSGIIRKDAKVEVLADDFQFTEGPLWIDSEKMLLVSDIPGNTIYKWTEAKGKEVYVNTAGYTGNTKRGGFMGPNGLVITRDGKLWICQHGDRRIAVMNAPLSAPQPKFSTVAGAYNGKKLNSPNDLFLASNGDLYFTDPAYGFEKGPGDPAKELPYQGVYRLDGSGKVTLLLDSINQPNGIGIMPDGKTLLVSNSDLRKRRWYTYTISKDGSLTGGKVFYDASADPSPGLCDGFKIVDGGHVFATGPGGIWIFAPNGELLGKIRLEGASAANCALTPDNKTIYITAGQYLLRVKMR